MPDRVFFACFGMSATPPESITISPLISGPDTPAQFSQNNLPICRPNLALSLGGQIRSPNKIKTLIKTTNTDMKKDTTSTVRVRRYGGMLFALAALALLTNTAPASAGKG